MNNIHILIVILIVLIACSAYFSATETAFSSVNKIKLKHIANKGNKRAQQVLDVLENYNRFLTTILIGNNIVNITTATISVVVFTSFFVQNGATISSIVMTVIILIFGEITPKTFAKQHNEEFAMATVSILKLVMLILKPLTILFSLWERVVAYFFKTKEESALTGEELITMIEEVEKDGSINASEGELIISAIEFNDAEVQDIFTPRVDVISVDVDWDVERIEDVFLNHPHSRLPIYEGNIDHIIGFIHERDLHKLAKTKVGTIKDIIQAPIRVTESMKISELLKVIQHNKTHLAIVIDEYGGTAGIVTLEDIIEELVGDIWDEHDEVFVDIEQISETTYLIDGSAYVEDVFERLAVDNDTEFDANTMSGWISEFLARIPEANELVHFKNLVMTILDADDKKVNQLKIEIKPIIEKI